MSGESMTDLLSRGAVRGIALNASGGVGTRKVDEHVSVGAVGESDGVGKNALHF